MCIGVYAQSSDWLTMLHEKRVSITYRLKCFKTIYIIHVNALLVHTDISEIINSNCWLAEDKLVGKWAVKVGSYSLQVESKIFFS